MLFKLRQSLLTCAPLVIEIGCARFTPDSLLGWSHATAKACNGRRRNPYSRKWMGIRVPTVSSLECQGGVLPSTLSPVGDNAAVCGVHESRMFWVLVLSF
ncbi:hypothetical protein DFH07DRAFT_829942 [Mycena maculata]|uniref:Uncharacterized protein n=1 Tax=Mycena maculata TaxID=230809 RepID=A0AAD7N7E8_9AGAR|nr:hypothetical protein DFH07DRAFT_829942 [Mycena maculata]